jgi:hypothetical protein
MTRHDPSRNVVRGKSLPRNAGCCDQARRESRYTAQYSLMVAARFERQNGYLHMHRVLAGTSSSRDACRATRWLKWRFALESCRSASAGSSGCVGCCRSQHCEVQVAYAHCMRRHPANGRPVLLWDQHSGRQVRIKQQTFARDRGWRALGHYR